MPSTTSLGPGDTDLLKTPGLNAKSSQQTPGSSTSSSSGTSPHFLALVVATSSVVALLVMIGVAVFWWWTFRVRERRRLFRMWGGSDLDSEAKAEADVRGGMRRGGTGPEREDLMEGELGVGLGPVLDIRATSTGTGTGTVSADLDKDSHGHGHDLPVIIISASGRDLANFKSTANDAEIYDHIAINSINARQLTRDDTSLDVDTNTNTNTGNDNDNGDTSGSSFYSDEMLEEISSIAADLKRFSRARSLDVEVKSIDSVKSFAMIVEVPDHEQQGLSAENVDVTYNGNDDPSSRDSMNEAIESLEALLLSLERMANERVYDENQAYSDDSIYSDDSAYLSTISAPAPVPVPVAEHAPVKPLKPLETIIEEDSVELLIVGGLLPIPGTPTTPGTSSDTTLGEDEIFVPSTSTPKKGTSSDTISALITALSSSPTVDDNTDLGFPKVSPPDTGTTLTLEPVAQHVLPGGTRAYLPFVNSIATLRVVRADTSVSAPESDSSRPALTRLPLGAIKSVVTNVSNGVSQLAPSRPPRRGRGRGHVRTSSREKSENSQGTKVGVPVPVPVVLPRRAVQQTPGRAMISSFR